MLKKLVKYDLIWINKFMLIYFIITFIVCILTRIAGCFTESFFGNILYLILRGVAISCFASVIINCVIRIWVRFKNNFYKDESYLTHTLPITKDTLYNSKVVSGFISLLISIIAIVLGMVIAFLDNSVIDFIKMVFNDSKMSFIFISLLITVVLEMFYLVNAGFIGILIGHKSNNHKILKSVFIGILLYFMMQGLLLGIVYSIGLINADIYVLFKYPVDLDILKSVKLLVIIVNIIYIVFITSMYFIEKKIFKKGVNVE